MKKKSLIIVACILALSVVFANTSYAKSVTKKISAVFGSYIVKVNGKTQKTTTLANGSTVYVPINDVSKLTGVTISKSGKTYNITPGVPRKNLDQLKLMVQFMDVYETFKTNAFSLNNLNQKLDYALSELQNKQTVTVLNDAINMYNTQVGNMNSDIDFSNSLEKKATKLGYSYSYDDRSFNSIVNNFSNSLDYFNKAIDDLKNYNDTGNTNYVEDYYSHSLSALDSAKDVSNEANEGYQSYVEKISKK